ncbi:hypothetical protein [Streptomyces sp. BBFR109]|uniref:hypothetical protein n=1 Tax=Streptomyces sp. BBFR109 TaxID=3448172 RepID=UPI003F7652EE
MMTLVLKKEAQSLNLRSIEGNIRLQRKDNTINLLHQGQAAAGSFDKTFVQAFTNSASVTVNHGLNKYPAVMVINSADDEVIGDIHYADLNTVVVTFSASFSGRVLCN